VITLVLTSAALVGLRLLLSDASRIPFGDSAWLLEWTIEADTVKGAVLRVALPRETRALRLLSRNLDHPGLQIERPHAGTPAADLVATTLIDGALTLRAEFRVHIAALADKVAQRPRLMPLSAEQRLRWLESTPEINVAAASTLQPLRSALGLAPRERLSRLFRFVAERIATDVDNGFDTSQAALREGRATVLGKARALVALCRAAGIPAALTVGFVLAEEPDARPHYWVEAWLENGWQPMDPKFGFVDKLPRNFLSLTRGRATVADLEGPGSVVSSFAISRVPVPRMLRSANASVIGILDIARLPLATRDTLGWLLIMPFGVLMTAFFQLIIGVRTFGTFTPTLLALSILAVDWRTAAVVCALVGLIGFAGRAALPEIALKRTPRLTIVIGLVALSMTLALSVMDYLGWNLEQGVVLLPVVVLSTLVDRLYGVADDNGLLVALVRLTWTCVVTLACVILFLLPSVRETVLRFPELHTLTAAAVIAMASYAGRRLSEFERAGWLREPKDPGQN
jgi:transglutaminase-like putative cysteine protease